LAYVPLRTNEGDSNLEVTVPPSQFPGQSMTAPGTPEPIRWTTRTKTAQCLDRFNLLQKFDSPSIMCLHPISMNNLYYVPRTLVIYEPPAQSHSNSSEAKSLWSLTRFLGEMPLASIKPLVLDSATWSFYSASCPSSLWVKKHSFNNFL